MILYYLHITLYCLHNNYNILCYYSTQKVKTTHLRIDYRYT